ncbi:hypothetical protein HPP92_022445 [Vanilla planifolia]|uniref:Uncharacterized protein n=1 Tax=Vanilla planifolia TaxID=51239 RepID=A0A835PQX6_VANPL|nr:hypothetical protein HPP92_022445 [Vanilla planifolia]
MEVFDLIFVPGVSVSRDLLEKTEEEAEGGLMAEDGKADAQLFGLLTSLLQQVEALSNQEEVELRAKIEALGLEVTKVPPKPTKDLDELELAAELDKLSAKLDDVDSMISSTIASNPELIMINSLFLQAQV